jgi:PadR family transcriptional regulator, regulatory protein PadR
MTEQPWPSDWMRSVLSLVVLAVVDEAETYGYAIAQRLHEAGLGTVKGGTLYPVLTRMEADGLLVSSWREGQGGPGRKFFSVTPAGRDELRRRAADWVTFTERASGLLPTEAVNR